MFYLFMSLVFHFKGDCKSPALADQTLHTYTSSTQETSGVSMNTPPSGGAISPPRSVRRHNHEDAPAKNLFHFPD